jgi:aspartate aminotransferase
MFPKALGWLRDAMAAVASETYTSTSAPIQYAGVRAFKGGPEIERYLKYSRRVLHALGNWCADKLRAAGATLEAPTGGFYLFPDFSGLRDRLAARGVMDCEQLCVRLLDEAGVAVLPGSSFGRPREELTARLAYVDFDGERALDGAAANSRRKRLDEDWLREHCRPTVEAIESMCDWLDA